MAYTKRSSKDTVLHYENPSSTWVNIEGVESVEWSSGVIPTIVATDLSSTRAVKLADIPDSAQITASIIWDEGAAGSTAHKYLRAAHTNRTSVTLRATWPDGSKNTAAVYVTDIPKSSGLGQAYKASITFETNAAETAADS